MTPNGEIAELGDLDWQSDPARVGALASSTDFEGQVLIARHYSTPNDREYVIRLLISHSINEGDVIEITDLALEERVGLIIPIRALCSRDHKHVQNEFFELVASSAFLFLVRDEQNQSCPAPADIDGVYELSDFYPANASILVLKCFPGSKPEPGRYVPRLFAEGFSIGSADIRLCAYLQKNPPSGKRRLKIRPISDAYLKEGYIELLYRTLLPFELSPIAQFVLLYQVFEMLMQSIFDVGVTDFKVKVASFAGTPSDLRQITEALRKVTSEQDRIARCIDNSPVKGSVLTELATQCRSLLQACGKAEIPAHAGHLLYDVRNLVFHNYREIPAQGQELVDAINGELICLVPKLLEAPRE